jgi:hypothetical protein
MSKIFVSFAKVRMLLMGGGRVPGGLSFGLLVLLMFAFGAANLQAQIRMSGTFAYSAQGNVVAFGVDRIDNFRSGFTTSGTLAIQLWATTAPYSGAGTLFGYKGAEVSIGTLQGGYYISPVIRTTTVNYASIPAGNYNIVFVLAEWNGFSYVTVDSGNFPSYVPIGLVGPSILQQPQGITISADSSAVFSVTASGTAPFSYQWRKGGVAISGATSAGYTIAYAQSGDAGSSTVVVTNSAGSATSSAATLTVNAAAVAPTITTQPASVSVTAGATATFNVVANGTALMSYQWRKGGVAISGCNIR